MQEIFRNEESNIKKAVITGPTGAVGMALVAKCLQEGMHVLAICRRGSERNARLPQSPDLTVIEVDCWDEIDESQEKDYDIFYHLAWSGTFGPDRDNTEKQLWNVRQTLDAVRLAGRLGCTAFVGAGSQAEYGRAENMLRPDTPAFPESGYGIAKLCAGQMSRLLCSQMGIRHIWVRILSVYGPYDRPETMVSSSLRKMLAGKETAFTPGEQVWDFLYSEDAAEALWLIGRKGKDKALYCLGSGEKYLLKEYINIMIQQTGYRGDPGLGKVPYTTGQVMHLCADISALTEDTGFCPGTDFASGIRKTIEWIKEDEKNQYSDPLL